MKTEIKIINASQIAGKTILEVELMVGNKILVGDVFKKNNISFKIKSVGIIESNIENVYPLVVEFIESVNNSIVGIVFKKYN